MIDREIYPNAPLVLVAAEIRHSEASAMSGAMEAAFKRALRPDFPISRPLVTTNVVASMGGPTQMTQTTHPRMMSRDRTVSVTMRPEAVVVETTSYLHFEALLEVIDRATAIRQEIAAVDGVERVGIRYIDEIRVPDLSESLEDWGAWVNPTMMGLAPVAKEVGLNVGPWQAIGTFTPDASRAGQAVSLRYGPGEGYAVDPSADLRRPTPPSGPFFLVDIDSYWTASDVIPAFEPAEIHQIFSELHVPVRALFESLITDRLREDVLRDVSR
ncbi:uncharacterized protein (TIGR04255 family) [Humibacillus xanthopallidus]|uniref:Uncharacterized protein (TIGR04255 family) n=1 Tax=Humibacillus xanthopallidus TaxID=412689 RepID=A0A543PM79_9MICO|nr:TIGR04255 family protein [Humibacillus xanthopallidus]TQN45182.1 uncharacterized protein (TIGR04255 family) [Humibacillus xanthopallidus]